VIDKKKIARTSLGQALMVSLFTGYLKLVYATLRWTREGEDRAEAVWAAGKAGQGAILCLWHKTIPLSPNAWPKAKATQEMRVLISQSSDGEFIAQAMERFDLFAIRGSSKKKTDPSKNKNGELAFREMIAWVKQGGAVAITPDGPRGPAEVMQPGIAALARMTGAPALLCGIAARPCVRLKTWDGTLVPLPFSRAAMVWDAPPPAERNADPDALIADWSARLAAASMRAEALVGHDSAPERD
jgi:lysophospholipid acyltransferase (LPLAT)-like uncharacterized protein